jgi:hypothetical protein
MNGTDEYSEYIRGAEPTEQQIQDRAGEILSIADFGQIHDWGLEMGLLEEMGQLLFKNYWVKLVEHIEDKLKRGEL